MASAPAPRTRRRGAARLAAVALVGGFLALLAYGLVSKAPNDTIDTSLSEDKPAAAPGFDLPVLQRGALGSALESRLQPALADARVSLRELRGRPVVLNFWASWCTPCRAEASRLERSWQGARGRGVVFAGLNMQDVTDDARHFMREFRMSYLNVRDRSNDVALDWGVTGIPETFFLRRDGKVVAHVIGAVAQEQLRRGVAAAESGRPLGALEGGSRRSTR